MKWVRIEDEKKLPENSNLLLTDGQGMVSAYINDTGECMWYNPDTGNYQWSSLGSFTHFCPLELPENSVEETERINETLERDSENLKRFC